MRKPKIKKYALGGTVATSNASISDSIAHAETRGEKEPYKARNPKSSATGKYQFIWSAHKKEIERLYGVKSQTEFDANPAAQEAYMKHWEKNTLRPSVARIRKAIPNTKYTDEQLMALTHFHGEGGARTALRNGTENKDYVNTFTTHRGAASKPTAVVPTPTKVAPIAPITPAPITSAPTATTPPVSVPLNPALKGVIPAVGVNTIAPTASPTNTPGQTYTSKGDPYEYQRNGQGQWQYRKQGTGAYVTATGKAHEAIDYRFGYQLGGKANKPFPLDPITITGKRIPKKPVKTLDDGTVVDTIYPTIANQFLFKKYNDPDYIVHRQKTEKELSRLEKALKKGDDILSAPSRYMTQAITGKYQDPSEAWGYKDPKGFWQNAANVGIDMVADPVNLLGVGIVNNTIIKTVPKLVKVGKAAEVVNDVNKSEYIVKASKDLARKYMTQGDNINKYTKGILDDDFAKYINVAYKELPEYKVAIEKSLKLNKPQATIALINDAINIKNTATNTYEPHYSKTSNFGPLASGYKGGSKPKQGQTTTTKLVTKPVKQGKIVEQTSTPSGPMLMNQYNKIVNGKKVPISKEEFALINSKGKVTSDTMPSLLKGVVPDSLKNKQKLQIRDISKMQLGGKTAGEETYAQTPSPTDPPIQNVELPPVTVTASRIKPRRFDKIRDVAGHVGSVFNGKHYNPELNQYTDEPVSKMIQYGATAGMDAATAMESKLIRESISRIPSALRNTIGYNRSKFNIYEKFRNKKAAKKIWGDDFKPEFSDIDNDFAIAVHGGNLGKRRIALVKDKKTGELIPMYKRTGEGTAIGEKLTDAEGPGEWVPYHGLAEAKGEFFGYEKGDNFSWMVKPSTTRHGGRAHIGQRLKHFFGRDNDKYDKMWPYNLNKEFGDPYSNDGDAAVNAMLRAYGYDVNKAASKEAKHTIKKVYQLGGPTEGPNLPPEGNQEMETPEILKGLQAEHKEMISTPDGQITNVAASKPHYSYTKDEITDNPEQGSFIGSAFEKMKLDKNFANFFVLGQVPQEYKEGQQPKMPITRTLANYFPKNKSTPAEVLKAIQRKIPLNLDKDDVFAAEAKKNNMMMRMPILQALAQMSDLQKQKVEQAGHTIRNKPMMQLGGVANPIWDTIKKAKDFIGTHQVPDQNGGRSNPWNEVPDEGAPRSYPGGDFTSDPSAVPSPDPAATELPGMDLGPITEATGKSLEQINLEINDPNSPAWVHKVPYQNIFTKGVIGNMGLALQNPNANYYNVNAGIKNKMFAPINTSQLQDQAKAAYNSNVIAPTMAYADQSGANVFQKANLVASKYSGMNNKLNDIAVNGTLKNQEISRNAATFDNDINYKNYQIGNQNIQSRNKKYADIAQFNIGLSNQYADARKYEGLYNEQRKGTLRNNQQTLLQTLAQLKYLQALNNKPIK